MTDYLFDADTRHALTSVGAGEFTAKVSSHWNIGGVPNGGFSMALCLAAAVREVPHTDPLSMSTHFLGKTIPGEAAIRCRVLKRGRSLSVTSVDLVQGERVTINSVITWGDLSSFTGPDGPPLPPPDLPAAADMHRGFQMTPDSSFTEKFDYLMPPDIAQGASGRPTGSAQAKGRMRFADGRPPDLLSMPLIADGFPPAIFQLGHYGWAPTLELTIHFRAHPCPGWLTVDQRARHLVNGTFEEDCNIWDSNGNLVAMSRQLGRTLAG